jgi:uncharacterized membrane protein
MRVTVVQGVAIVVFAGILLLATVNVQRQWRGERPLDTSSVRTLRGRPSVVAAGWLMLAGVALTIVGTNIGEPGATVVAFVLALVLLALVIALAVWGLTVATGRPTFAVPPPLRRRGRGERP